MATEIENGNNTQISADSYQLPFTAEEIVSRLNQVEHLGITMVPRVELPTILEELGYTGGGTQGEPGKDGFNIWACTIEVPNSLVIKLTDLNLVENRYPSIGDLVLDISGKLYVIKSGDRQNNLTVEYISTLNGSGGSGVGITDITTTKDTENNANIITIYTSDDKTYNFEVKNGDNGKDGISITSIVNENATDNTEDGAINTYEVWGGTKFLGTFKVKNGSKGSDFTYEDFTPEQLEDLKGAQGEPGYTPQKGVDYFDGKDGKDRVYFQGFPETVMIPTKADGTLQQNNAIALKGCLMSGDTKLNVSTSQGDYSYVYISDKLEAGWFVNVSQNMDIILTITPNNMVPATYSNVIELQVVSNGVTYTHNISVIPSADGTVGADGVSVTETKLNGNGELIITLSNGTETNVGKIVGDKGDTGNSGVYVGSEEPTDPNVSVWIDTAGETNVVDVSVEGA